MTESSEPSLRGRIVGYRASRDLSGHRAAARVSAYLYGNIILFATLIPVSDEQAAHGHGLKLVFGVAVSTYVAHVFAEIVGHSAQADEPMTRAAIRHEQRDSLPIVSSALLPCVLLGMAWAGWLSGGTAVLLSAIYLLVRMAMVGFLVERLRSTRPSFRTLLAGIALATVALAIALLKVLLGH
ncbi:hypothetical protein [Dactylosporangium sp. NPDC005555]|uniref:hypothetical protein n=1 Tax=Dactylosporangium sp. NPDC005555 TaxID=3154889 RepID=UPI0033A165D7